MNLCREIKWHIENLKGLRWQIEPDYSSDVDVGEIDVFEMESDAEREDVETWTWRNGNNLDASWQVIQVNRLDFVQERVGKIQLLF